MKTNKKILAAAVVLAVFLSGSAFSVEPASSNLVEKAEIKKPAGEVKSFSGRVKSKTVDSITLVLVESQGVQGLAPLGTSILNGPVSKPKKALSGGTAQDRERARAEADRRLTFVLKGYPEISRVFIGSTISFRGVKNEREKSISWSE